MNTATLNTATVKAATVKSTTTKNSIASTALLAVAALACTGNATADGHNYRGYSNAESFGVQARVLDIEPLVRTVQVTVPQEVCWEEPVRRTADNYNSATPKVLGGIIGGVIGNKFGSGSGNKIMTAAGAILGASIGRDAQYRNRQARGSYVSYEQVCEIEQVTHEEERTDGYRVTYEYGGREFVTYSDVPPGDYIRLRVRVEPAA